MLFRKDFKSVLMLVLVAVLVVPMLALPTAANGEVAEGTNGYSVTLLQGSATVDGEVDEIWEHVNRLYMTPATDVKYKFNESRLNDTWFKAMYDPTECKLYLLVHVIDGYLMSQTENEAVTNFWARDGVLLTVASSKDDTIGDTTDGRFLEGGTCWIDACGNHRAQGYSAYLTTAVKRITENDQETGEYYLEACFDMKILAQKQGFSGDFTMSDEAVFYMDVSAIDCDGLSDRYGYSAWNATTDMVANGHFKYFATVNCGADKAAEQPIEVVQPPVTDDPTDDPTDTPTDDPTDDPTNTPTDDPTDTPTNDPTDNGANKNDSDKKDETPTETGTAASTAEPEKSGCASTVGVTAALMLTLALGAAATVKKKQ